MCGLFGYVLNDTAPGFGVYLGVANDKRGGHSWGYADIGDTDVEYIVKGLGKFRSFKHGRKFQSLKRVLGHTRLATTGKHTIKNAHPFDMYPLIGAHNGMVYNHWELSHTYKRDFEVDSQHIFQHLIDGLAFDDIEGYGAITWVDRRDMKVRLCVLKNGSLSVRRLYRKGEVLGVGWSSTDHDLMNAIRFSGIKESMLYEMDEGQVYTVNETGLYFDETPKLEFAERIRYNWHRTNWYSEKWDEMEWADTRDDSDSSYMSWWNAKAEEAESARTHEPETILGR